MRLQPEASVEAGGMLGSSGLDAFDDLLRLLAEHGTAAVLTREEDLLLTQAGLANRMPEGWDGQDV